MSSEGLGLADTCLRLTRLLVSGFLLMLWFPVEVELNRFEGWEVVVTRYTFLGMHSRQR